MRFIDLDNHRPDEAWLRKSDALTRKLIELHEKGDIKARNKLIKNNSGHWGKLKDWLLSLSHNKCWFSEARDIYSYMDVEHYRPKLEAKDLQGITRDGYWWLAFDYHNFRVCGNVGNRQKGGWFPLQIGSVISTYDHPCEESEVSYFLDPTNADDVNLIAFDEEGKATPAPGISDWDKERVLITISRLKLNEHEAITLERRKVWQRMTREIDKYLYAKSRNNLGRNPGAQTQIKECARNIRNWMRDSEELSAVSKWCVLFRNDSGLSKLIA